MAKDLRTALPPPIPPKLREARNTERSTEEGYRNPARLISQIQGANWEDLSAPGQPVDSALMEALTYSQQKLGLLQARQPGGQFLPDEPVTLGVFAQWLGAYLGQTVGPAESGDIASRLQLIQQAGWLPANLPIETPLTRLMLCQVYLKLSKVPLATLDLEDAMPSDADAFEGATQLKGWPLWPMEARQAVAVSYQHGVLKRVFGLTPTHLIKGTGLESDRPVTRREALIFLYNTLGQS